MVGVVDVLLRRARGVGRGLRRAADVTPPGRDRYIDLLRAVAISAVVVGHWLASVVTYRGGFGGGSALEAVAWTLPLTWVFQVMPVFFFVGGFANAASLDSYRRRGGTAVGWVLGRTDRLVRPTTMFLSVLAGAALVALLLGVGPQAVAMGVWVAKIPLWFLVVYVAVVFLTPMMTALHRWAGLIVPVVLAGLVGLGDLARLGFEVPLVAYGNFLFAWLAVHQLGIAWREGALPARRNVALPLAAGGLIVVVALTTAGPYPMSMVTENTSPPTLALLELAVTQIGLALLLRERGNQWLARIRPWTVVVAVNSVVMTLFLWHMTALVITAVAVYPTGLMPQPPPGSAAWVLSRLPWLAALAVVLAALVVLFGGVERRAGPRPSPEEPASGLGRRVVTVTGSAAVVVGLLGVAMTGPGGRTVADLPIAGFLVYVTGAALLGRARRRPGS